MCLDTVTQTKNLPKWGVGYKVVSETGRSIFFGDYESLPYEVKKTYNDKESITNLIGGHYDIPGSERKSMLYPPGFHIFKLLNNAKRYLQATYSNLRIFKVRFSQCTAIGTQYIGSDINAKTIVARRMTILSKVSP